MAYIALYRKYRPKTFADIIGQEHITSTLSNQIKSSKISHAYLFCGIRGTGKTSAAKVFAKAINCREESQSKPCGACQLCIAQENDSMPDIIEIDAASNRGIEEIRQIRESVKYRPAVGGYKVYIIDEAHMLTGEAFNALLKTLEEPPEYVVFILATTEPHKLPLTIISRTQRYDFRRLDKNVIKDHLIKICVEENINISPKAALCIAELSEGALRDALSVLDKCATYASSEQITQDTVNFISGRADDGVVLSIIENAFCSDIDNMLSTLNEALCGGLDISTVLNSILSSIRDIIICKSNPDAKDVLTRGSHIILKMNDLATKIELKDLIKALDLLIEAQNRIAFAYTPVYVLECALLHIATNRLPVHNVINTKNIKPDQANTREKEIKSQPVKNNIPQSAEKFQDKKAVEKKVRTTLDKKLTLNNKDLKKELILKLYEQYPLIALGVEKADIALNNDSLEISVPEYVYSMIGEDKKYKEYIINTIRDLAQKKEISVNVLKKEDIKTKALEAFGDIIKFEE